MEHMEFALMQKVDHMCKPDMRKKGPDDLERPKAFDEWIPYMTAFAAFLNTYMKLSGGLSEMDPFPSASELAEMDF
jgi:L-rhamnono-1,4-lactonase